MCGSYLCVSEILPVAGCAASVMVASSSVVAPGFVDSVTATVAKAGPWLSSAAFAASTVAACVLAPFVGVVALLATIAVALLAEDNRVSAYGRQGEPEEILSPEAAPSTALALSAPQTIDLECPHCVTSGPLAQIESESHLMSEVDRLTAQIVRAEKSRHRARAAKYRIERQRLLDLT